MKKAGLAFFGLALCAALRIVSAQDKNVALLNQYSALSEHADRAAAALKHRDLEKCEREALVCLEKLPWHHEARLLMCQVLYKRGDFGGALDHIRAAEDGYLALTGAISAVEQQRKKAQTDSVAGLIDDVQEIGAADAATKGRGSCQPDRYSKALEDAKNKLIKDGQWNDDNPDQATMQIPAQYHYLHGNCLFRLKRLAEAAAEYQLAVRINPDYGDPYNNLINVLFMEKRLEQARAFLAQAEAHKAAVHPGLKQAVLDAK